MNEHRPRGEWRGPSLAAASLKPWAPEGAPACGNRSPYDRDRTCMLTPGHGPARHEWRKVNGSGHVVASAAWPVKAV